MELGVWIMEGEETHSIRYAYHNLSKNYFIAEDISKLERVLRTSWPHVTHGTSMNRLYANQLNHFYLDIWEVFRYKHWITHFVRKKRNYSKK